MVFFRFPICIRLFVWQLPLTNYTLRHRFHFRKKINSFLNFNRTFQSPYCTLCTAFYLFLTKRRFFKFSHRCSLFLSLSLSIPFTVIFIPFSFSLLFCDMKKKKFVNIFIYFFLLQLYLPLEN